MCAYIRGSHTGIYVSVYTRDAYIAVSDTHIQSIHQYGGHIHIRIYTHSRQVYMCGYVCVPDTLYIIYTHGHIHTLASGIYVSYIAYNDAYIPDASVYIYMRPLYSTYAVYVSLILLCKPHTASN